MLTLRTLIGALTFCAVAEHAGAASSMPEHLRAAEEAAPMRQVAERFIDRAMAGDGKAAGAMLSRVLVERSGEAQIQQALSGQILPFFARGREVGRSVTIARTTDAAGQGGFAFYMWLVPTDGGAARPFSVYVVQEQGRPVVANIVPDRLVEGRHR